jgi:hypothetical protein
LLKRLTFEVFGTTTLAGLLELLMVGRAFDTTDARDKVYSVLGMAEVPIEDEKARQRGAPANCMRIDYSASISKVYQYLAKYIINRDQNLDILCILSTHRDAHSGDLPTWTPDWRVPTSTRSMYQNWDYFSYKWGAAGFTKTASQDQTDLGRLRVQGFVVANVTKLLPLSPTSIPHPPEAPSGDAILFDPDKHVRRFAMMEKGEGVVPASAVEGDAIWIVYGCKMPIALREVRNRGAELVCQVVGPCYVSVAMFGSALKAFHEDPNAVDRTVILA